MTVTQCGGNTISATKLHTCMTRGIIPGWVEVPCIVWVFPEEVTPYAKIVTVLLRKIEVNVPPKSNLG